MYKLDQSNFGSRVKSMDVEDMKTKYYDTLRMAGELEISSSPPVLRTRVESEIIFRFGEDRWRHYDYDRELNILGMHYFSELTKEREE